MTRPSLPSSSISEACPSLEEIKGVVKLKRNSAAPGPDGIGYLPYKKCPCLAPVLFKIFKKVWETKDTPPEWAAASIQLLPKTANLHDPAEFRPIALTNTIGKIFFGVFAKRLEAYMASNNYISKVQKGFKANTPGCLEHSFAMFEALRDAKLNQRQVVVAWLDLCNAYGSVHHNLIQFALEWYHVPSSLRSLIFDYYNKIRAHIRTKSWTSDVFFFDKGLFQGCVLSCILFNCVFQLILDMISPLGALNGYKFKDKAIVLHDQAFADDLSVIASSPAKAQETITAVEEGVAWAGMQTKPPKCVCMGMKKFDPRWEHKVEYSRLGDTVYCPFDPNLTIDGKKTALHRQPCRRSGLSSCRSFQRTRPVD